MGRASKIAICVGVVLVSGTAAGDDDDAPLPDYPADPEHAPRAPADPGAARGLEKAPAEPEDDALAVPRAILFLPAHALDLVFTPLRWFGWFIDEYHVRQHVIDFLYNDDRTAAFYPIFTVESGFGPSIGLGAFHEDLFGHEEHLSGRVQFLGQYEQSYRAVFEAEHFLGTPLWLESRFHYQVEPGLMFAGIDTTERPDGPIVAGQLHPRAASVSTRFWQERVLALARVGATIGDRPRMAKVGATAIYNHRFAREADSDFDEPPIDWIYDTSRLVGFDEGWNTFELDSNLVVDTRDTRGFTSSGVLFEAFGGGVMPDPDHGAYGHYGAEGTVFADLFRRRVLAFRLATEGMIGSERDMHFADLPQLGGPKNLRGYKRGIYRGKTSVVGSLQYNWPVHTYLSGELFVDVGKVGDDYESIFAEDPTGWRPGLGGGVLVHSEDDALMRFDVAWGMRDDVSIYFTTGALQDLDHRSSELW